MIEQLLLAGQLLVVVLIYVFAWRVLATGRRELRALARDGAGSTVVTPGQAAGRAASEDSLVMPSVGGRTGPTGSTRLVAVSGGGLRPGQPFHMDEPLLVGRNDNADIQLEDDFISGEHARLRPPDLLDDLESTNGTFVNGQRVHGTTRLRNADMVRFGDVQLRFEDGRQS